MVPTLPVMILVLGLTAAAGGGLAIERLAEARERQRFESLVNQANSAIADRLATYVAVLQASAGLFAASDVVTHKEFKAFAERAELTERYPGIQGIGYSARIAPGAPDAEERHAILFLEPEVGPNRLALGFDMYAEPVRREAMARARDTGLAAMSGKVRLVQETEDNAQSGFLIYEPVYAGGGVPASLEDRRRDLVGFVYAPFRAGDLLQAVFDTVSHRPYRYSVYNGAIEPENLLFRSDPGAGWVDFGPLETRQIEVAGGRWTVVYRAGPDYVSSAARQLVWAFVLGGFLATGLVAAATWRQGMARLAAEREVVARKAAEARQKLLLDELNHRVKNTLATVQSIAAQSLRETGNVEDVRANFENRLIALSQAHNLLTRDGWRGANLAELAQTELRPYGGLADDRIELRGPAVWLAPNTAVALGMALHELTTNAVKYGALSVPEGRIDLSWDLAERDADTERLTLRWRESGGPPVAPPTRRGFGTRLIVGGLAHQLDGDVALDFPPEGVICAIGFDIPRQVAADILSVGAAA
ncbi:CHASE domain-containing protein [Phenylobacterium sp.]|uniref:CHASE domain-containing protein n=1 Tax=Phenylobacterium sp. TaxID=1871053 RepID=UPI00272F2FFA|nr:CHASE domain-containing protein [Phenylobacterium sp.]MDP1874479.1 CHASE domain-containing protein [Phenylobacterium sp.]MDP3490528.1 CHASE domain-containing protein [Phenylobacterium sp.]